ncbi:hypothetical protein HAX54_005070, partial [Datura stramonium]|nr:hypothetical protein [Datura stramonium]
LFIGIDAFIEEIFIEGSTCGVSRGNTIADIGEAIIVEGIGEAIDTVGIEKGTIGALLRSSVQLLKNILVKLLEEIFVKKILKKEESMR